MKEYLKGMLEDTKGGYWDYNMLLPVVKVQLIRGLFGRCGNNT
jgi:hypothetical protein